MLYEDIKKWKLKKSEKHLLAAQGVLCLMFVLLLIFSIVSESTFGIIWNTMFAVIYALMVRSTIKGIERS
jgi:hypothetical protein